MALLLSQICLSLFLQQSPLLHEPYVDEGPAFRDLPGDGSGATGEDGAGGSDRHPGATGDDAPDAPANRGDPAGPPAELDPKALAELRRALQAAMATPSLQMDPKTDSFTPPDNFSRSVFTPSVFPNERVWVLDTVRISRGGRVEAVPGPVTVESVPVDPTPAAGQYTFFWAEYQLGAPGSSSILPTPAPGFVVTEVPSGVHLLRNGDDMLYFKPGSFRQSTLRIRLAAPRAYFREPAFDDVALPAPRPFDGALQLRGMSQRVFGRPDRGFLGKMMLYFRGFSVRPLLPYGNRISLEEAILTQKRGVCRHRALLFFAIAQAWGYDVRLVLNEVHAFCEVRLPGQPWVRVDLGGAVLPRDFTPPTGPGLFSVVTYRYQLTGGTAVSAGDTLLAEVFHRDRPPALLWAILLDAAGSEVSRFQFFPRKTTIEPLRVPIPAGLPGGRYRLILKPDSPP